MSTPTLFQGEAQLRRWSNTSTQGASITLALHDEDALEAWKGQEGKRVMLVAVLIGDDEMPVQPTPPKGKDRKRSARAFLLCGDRDFRRWISRNGTYDPDFHGADAYIKDECSITSKSELDSKQGAADAFDLMCVDFNEWMEARR